MTSPIACDTIISAKYIIPITPQGGVLENHALVVNKGVIVDLLQDEEAKNKYSASALYELPSHVLTPGLINAHGHSAMTLFRGLANDLPLMDWLNDYIWPAEGQHVSKEFVRDGTRLAIAEMIKCGTTCFSDMYFFPEISAEVAKETGIRAQLCCPILDFPTVYGSGAEDYIEKALSLSKTYKNDSLISVGLGPHAPYTVSDEPLKRIKSLAVENQLPVQIHLHETQQEIDDALSSDSKRPIQRIKELGLFDDDVNLQCVHMTTLNDDDISILKSSTASVIHCPESNMKLASGFCETQKLLDEGINVAIGTDGAASNNDLDMLGEIRTAALIAKPIANNASAVNATTALEMATINGAKALKLEDTCGSLELGKCADVIAINLNQLNSQPSFDPLADIVYSVSSTQVTHNWVAGNILLRDRKLVRFDESELIATARKWAEKIKPR